ncbi:MAG TPA: hypothetical protein VI653_21025 [Steroidobacteraceae bacterium]
MSEQLEPCVWQQDKTLRRVLGYHMTCLEPVGTTRVVSSTQLADYACGFNFCPYCGKPMVLVDSPEIPNA